MFKNISGQKIALFAFDTSTSAPKTGDAANLTAYVSKDYGSVSALGDSSATEISSTNAPGWYLWDLTQGETNADALLFSAKSSTSNVSLVGQLIYTVPANFTALSINGSGQVDVTKINGTSQTAGDVYAKVSGLTYTVANQIDVNVVDWKGSTAPAMTGDAYARLGAPAGASVSADVAALKSDLDAGVTVTSNNDKTGYVLTSGERTSVADALLDRDMSAGTDSGSTTVRTVRQALRALRNKISISGSTLTVTKEDDSTSSWTAAVTTDPSANPITTIDPAGP